MQAHASVVPIKFYDMNPLASFRGVRPVNAAP